MTIAAIRKELHQLIDTADVKKLKAIHLLLEDKSAYTDEELEQFYNTLDKYERGDLPSAPVEVSHRRIREKIAKRA